MQTVVKRFSILLLVACLSTPAFAGYKLIGKPLKNDPMKVHIYELDNGLQVYLTENRETPRFYVETAVRAGSKHDPAESTGLAHYLEHILFKGTQKLGTLDYEKEKVHLDKIEALYEQHFVETDPKKRAELYKQINEETVASAQYSIPNEMDRLYKSMGGTKVNAHTWHEETVYKVELPANRLNQWAVLESDRFANPVFRLFVTELETVYEELNRALDNKQRLIMYAVDDILYKKHPYGQQPTIGITEHLKNPSLKNIGTYFDTYYVPNNMAIFISGDIDIEETIQVIDEHFSSMEPKELPELPNWTEPTLSGREYVECTYEGEEFVMIAFRTEPNDHKDAEALMLVDMILDNATAGLINLNLNQAQKVRQAGSYPTLYNDYGAQYLYGIPKEGQTLEEVEALLLEQLEIIKSGEFDDWILGAIVNDFKKNLKTGLESDDARVSAMRDSWLDYSSWKDTVKLIDRMEKVKKKDVVRVANKYFGKDYVCGFRKDAPHKVPDFAKPELAKIEIDPRRASPFSQEILAMPFDAIEPSYIDPAKDYTVVQHQDGIELYHVPNPVNDIFSFSITIDKGIRHDNRLNLAAQLLDKSGTANFSSEELQKEWYKLGTNFGIGSGPNSTSITLSGLDENFGASLALLVELLQLPQSDNAVLEELKKIILVGREDAKKQIQSISQALYNYNRYGDQSPFLTRMTTAEMQAVDAATLYGLVNDLLGYEQTISYTGSMSIDEVRAILNEHHPAKGTLKATPEHVTLTARDVEEDAIYFFNKESAQAHVRIEFGTSEVDEARNAQVQLFNNYFSGGMAGLVFQELREARALAYSAGARYHLASRLGEEDLMLGVIQTQNDKTNEALEAFIELYDAIPESEQRFNVAKQSIISRYRTGKIGFRGISGTIRAWEDLGLEPDPRASRYARVQEASMADMLEFQHAVIKDQPKLISITGDKSKMDMDRFAKIGPVLELTLSDIFSD